MSKKIFVVGMGEGISMGVVIKFANEGYQPVMFARNLEKLENLKKILESENISSTAYQVDSSDEKNLVETLTTAMDAEGVPDVFLYNPAVVKPKGILEEDYESLVSDFKVNVAGAVVSASCVAERMKERGNGTIMFTGGGLSMYPNNEYGSLSIGKAGVKNLTQSIAQALDDTGLKVGTVTINGFVSKEDKMYNPTTIAEQFWKLHSSMSNGSDIDY